MMKFSVVIPAFDHFELTGALLMDLYQNCTNLHEVIVVDDCSKKEETRDGYAFWKRLHEHFPLRIIELPENVGFLKASNAGLKAATGDIVALISNDVRVKKDLPKFVEGIIKTPSDRFLLGGRLLDWDTGWNEFKGRIYPYVEGWLLIATKNGWEELGYFDERYAPNDAEDIDLSTTALAKGYKLTQFHPWQGEVVEHIGAQSIPYGEAREAITKENIRKFQEKWITQNSENA